MARPHKPKIRKRRKIRRARLISWYFEKGKRKHLEELSRWFKTPTDLMQLREWKRHRLGNRFTGIYALYKRKNGTPQNGTRQIYYVGKAQRLNSRVEEHLEDEHKGRWNEFSLYGMDKRTAETLETLLIKIADPEANKRKKGARFAGSVNLKRDIRNYYGEKRKEF